MIYNIRATSSFKSEAKHKFKVTQGRRVAQWAATLKHYNWLAVTTVCHHADLFGQTLIL